MQFKRIFGPTRIDTRAAGARQIYRLKGQPGGRLVKTLQYMIKVYQTGDATETQVGLEVEQGPDGEIYAPLFDVIPLAPVNATTQAVLMVNAVGAPDSNDQVIGEWILPVVKIEKTSGGTGEKWAVVEVFEMRKAF